MKKHISILLLGFTFVAQLAAQRNPLWATPVETKTVENLYLIDCGVYRSAQSDEEAFSELKQLGIKEVLNLRYFNKKDKVAAKSGLTRHHVRMLAGNCDWDKVVEALQIIKNRQGPIVIHCKHGADRTGLIVAMYRIVFQGWDKESAIDELENGGFNFHKIYANIPSFIRNVDVVALKEAAFK